VDDKIFHIYYYVVPQDKKESHNAQGVKEHIKLEDFI